MVPAGTGLLLQLACPSDVTFEDASICMVSIGKIISLEIVDVMLAVCTVSATDHDWLVI